jgi:hypothetical protein
MQQLPEDTLQPTGILLQDSFPTTTKRYEFTPQDVHKALLAFAKTPTNLDTCLDNQSIRKETYWELEKKFPEIRKLYLVARAQHSKAIVAEAHDLYNELPEWAYETDWKGSTRLSNAGMTWLRDKFNARMRVAQVHETGSTIPASKSETTAKSFNFNVNVNAGADVVEAAQQIEDLLNPPIEQ